MPKPLIMQGQQILTTLRALRPRWAWISLALGLPWLTGLVPGPSSALAFLRSLSGLAFVLGAITLGVLGLRWSWRTILYRVSRRLWFILVLVSVLPAVMLTGTFIAAGWVALGGQASRAIKGTVQNLERVVREANENSDDDEAIRALQLFGPASTQHVTRLPKGLKPTFVGMTYSVLPDSQDLGLTLTAVRPMDKGFRILTMQLGGALAQSQRLWGGRIHFGLSYQGDRKGPGMPSLRDAEAFNRTWSEGLPPRGAFIFAPFTLPGTQLYVTEVEHGYPLSITATTETSLVELLHGYGFGEFFTQGNQGIGGRTFLQLMAVAGLLFLASLLQLGALAMGMALVQHLGRAVNALAMGVERLTAGDFKVRIQIRGYNQLAALGRAFNTMAERLGRAEEERGERLRLEEELKVAREVQMRLLPDLSRLTPAIQATILPAREVAGDYFDVLKLDDTRFAFLIADVSGKGTSAAFYAAETKGVLAALDKDRDPREVLARMNEIWCASNARTLFMTAIYGTFDTATGAFSLVRAGHPAAFVRRADGTVERLAPRGLGIGMTRSRFRELTDLAEGRLEPGDCLLCCTDGLVEALSPEDQLYGEGRLAECLAQASGDIQKAVLADVEQFTAGRPLEDDLTLLVVRA